MKKIFLTTSLLAFLFISSSQLVFAQQEGFMGEIKLFGGTFAPKFWMYCDGQVLQISQNSALFSILGNQYGGNGTTTFALPKLNSIASATSQSVTTKPVLGESRTSTGGSTSQPGMGNPTSGSPVRYIICVQGVYPSRQ